MFAYGTHYAAKEHSWKSSGKTYYYVWAAYQSVRRNPHDNEIIIQFFHWNRFELQSSESEHIEPARRGTRRWAIVSIQVNRLINATRAAPTIIFSLQSFHRMYDQGPADYKYESLNPTSMEAQNIRRMTGIFESFAANGWDFGSECMGYEIDSLIFVIARNPSIHGMQSKWLAIEGSQINYVQLLTFGIVDGVDPNKGRFIFWDNIFNRDHTTSSSQIYHFNIICLIPCLCLIINKYYIWQQKLFLKYVSNF